MKKISIYFSDLESLETASKLAEYHGIGLLVEKTKKSDYLRPIISDDGSVHGWISVYTDEHDCVNDLKSEEASAYIES